jgi:hypothetical protein
MLKLWGALPLLLSIHFLAADAAFAQAEEASTDRVPPLQLTAQLIEEAVTIDGGLSEPAWEGADTANEFLQFEPDEGAPVTHPTEVRVLYGPRSVYIGAMLFDDAPERIQQTLGRRDEYMQADWFAVSIDSHLDRRTAHLFAVNAAGVEYDAMRIEGENGQRGPGGGGDASWDAIWDSAVRVTPDGWSVEMEIPYSMLRFSRADVQTWGVHFSREIPRLGEVSEWPLVRRTDRANLIARFGTLQGISGIEPRRNLQITPYTLSRLSREEDPGDAGGALHETGFDAGADVRLGLGSNVTLNATVNPDFGQVESDPAELNLTAFETFFPERRPFFVEGSQIYQFTLVGPSNSLLYTRRIGAINPVLGAAKLSSRTADGLSFGVLGATTGDNFRGGQLRQYGAARASQQFGRYSSAGGMLTFFDGPAAYGRHRALAGGADWDLRFADNTYSIEGFTAFTQGSGLDLGFTGQVMAARRSGPWTYEIGGDFVDDRFDPNDVGRQRSNNAAGVIVRAGHDLHSGRSFGPFQRAEVGGHTFNQWSYAEGINLGGQVSMNSEWMLRDFQQVELGVGISNLFGGYDLFETRGLWPNRIPASYSVEASYRTDDRRAWRLSPQMEVSLEEDGGEVYTGGLSADWNVRSRLTLSAEADVEWGVGTIDWASNETFRRGGAGWEIGERTVSPARLEPDEYAPIEGGSALERILSAVAPSEGPQYYVPVFGARDTRTIDLTLRTSYTFTPDLALQFYGQFFVARARFDEFRILSDRDTYAPFDAFPKRYELSRSSFQFNAVLRWEYRPGSEVYVVWTQSRRADDELHPLAPAGPSPYDRPFTDQITDTFGIFPGNVFLIKLNYTFLN